MVGVVLKFALLLVIVVVVVIVGCDILTNNDDLFGGLTGEDSASTTADAAEGAYPGLVQSGRFEGTGSTVYGVFTDGNIYELKNGRKKLAVKCFEPGFHEEAYVTRQGKVYIKSGDDSIETIQQCFEGFEDARSIRDLVATDVAHLPDRIWTSMTLLSPRVKEGDYDDLRDRILTAGGKFVDNVVDVSDDVVKTGAKSLKTHSVAGRLGMAATKASLDSQIFYFVKGDDIWFSADYYIAEGRPHTIADWENSYFKGYPGMRLILTEQFHLGAELAKWFAGPEFKHVQRSVRFPREKWVNVRAHLHLSDEKEEGQIQLWQDGEPVLDKKAQTLPTADSVYNTFEVGISAALDQTTLYVDNVKISNRREGAFD